MSLINARMCDKYNKTSCYITSCPSQLAQSFTLRRMVKEVSALRLSNNKQHW